MILDNVKVTPDTEQQVEERKALLQAAIPVVEAKKQGILYGRVPHLNPSDAMFLEGGIRYPTKCFLDAKIPGVHRKMDTLINRPLIYDFDYVLHSYNTLIIRDLSLENQLVLLKAITDSYGGLVGDNKGSLEDEFNKLDADSRLTLLKKLANQLGKRVINK